MTRRLPGAACRGLAGGEWYAVQGEPVLGEAQLLEVVPDPVWVGDQQ